MELDLKKDYTIKVCSEKTLVFHTRTSELEICISDIKFLHWNFIITCINDAGKHRAGTGAIKRTLKSSRWCFLLFASGLRA